MLINVLLFVHVFAGFVSLLTGMMAFILQKGTPFHIRLGKTYHFSMLIVFLTSVYVSLVKENWFLLLVGIFSYYMVQSGLRFNSYRVKRDLKWTDPFRVVFYGLSFAAMIFLGLISLTTNTSLAIVLLVFGAIGVSLVALESQVFLFARRTHDHNIFMREHIGRMTGSYIAASTAFLVNNIHFLPPLAIWLGPTAIGFFVINYFSRPYKRKRSLSKDQD
jgi:hypothetical protein